MVVVSDLDAGIDVTITTVNGRQFSGTTDRVTDDDELNIKLNDDLDEDEATLRDEGDAIHIVLTDGESIETDTIRKDIS